MIPIELLSKEVDMIKGRVIEIRRDFHMHPELGDEEYRTSARVREILDELSIENMAIAGTGVIGTIYGARQGGLTIGMRADMDALPIQDQKNVPYSSKEPGKMHACGHDAHTAILLGAAMVLSKFKHMLPGNVRLIFQPAEETDGGAKRMISMGALSNPDVNAVIGLHMEETIDTGCIGIKYGQSYAASNPFEIILKGRGSHGACPHDGVDAIAISAQVISALQTLMSRELNPLDSAVITIGTISGGNAPNVICDMVVLKGILRTLNKESREKMKFRIRELVNGIAESMRGSCEINISEGYPCLINDNQMTDLLKEAALKTIGPNGIIILDKPGLGVEDFAYFGERVPSVFYKLGCRDKDRGIVHPAHGCFFDIDEDSISTGILLQCQLALDYLSNIFN